MFNKVLRLKSVLALLVSLLAAACSPGNATHTSSALTNAKFMSNPVAATPQSLASGKSAYSRLCADCHGVAGNGVSAIAEEMKQLGEAMPLNLIDDHWKYGSTDGEMFTVIRDGLADGSMKGLNGRPGVGPQEMWNIVNYVRSLSPRH